MILDHEGYNRAFKYFLGTLNLDTISPDDLITYSLSRSCSFLYAGLTRYAFILLSLNK